MQNMLLGYQIIYFDLGPLPNYKGRSIKWIYRWICWTTPWWPIQFRQVKRVLLNRTQNSNSGLLITQTTDCQRFESNSDPDRLPLATTITITRVNLCILSWTLHVIWMMSANGNDQLWSSTLNISTESGSINSSEVFWILMTFCGTPDSYPLRHRPT